MIMAVVLVFGQNNDLLHPLMAGNGRKHEKEQHFQPF